MDYFGGRNVSGIIGVLYTSAGIGTLVGPSAAGFAFDISHSYTVPILVSAAGNVIAAVIMAVTSESPVGEKAGPKRRRGDPSVPGNPQRAADVVDAALRNRSQPP